MFDLEEATARWRQQMRAVGIRKNECLDELEAHVREDFEHSIRSGLNPETAFDDAIRRLGQGGALAGEFQESRRAGRRQWIYRGLCLGMGVFALAVTFSYFVMLPFTMTATAAYMKWLGFSQLRLEHDVYIRFAARLVVGLSLCFEIPVLVLTLVKTGAIDRHSLSKSRKYVLILNLVLAAIIVGPGVIPQLALFVLLQCLYELGLLLSRSGTKRDLNCSSQA
jgi:hypothetical protein